MSSQDTMRQAEDQGRKADAIDAEIAKINQNTQSQVDHFQQKANAYRNSGDDQKAAEMEAEVAKVSQTAQGQIDGFQQQSTTMRGEQQRLMKQSQDELAQEKEQAQKEADEAQHELKQEQRSSWLG